MNPFRIAFDKQSTSRRWSATQVEALPRLRNGVSQFVRVERVHVNDGGQAIIGNVRMQTVRRASQLWASDLSPASALWP
jgi:hypothetical protein